MIPVKILAARYLPGADEAFCKALGVPQGYRSLGLITTDCDDATYIAELIEKILTKKVSGVGLHTGEGA